MISKLQVMSEYSSLTALLAVFFLSDAGTARTGLFKADLHPFIVQWHLPRELVSIIFCLIFRRIIVWSFF